MDGLFSREWVEQFAAKWNADPDMVNPLNAIGVNAIVAFGYMNAEHPAILLEITDGKVQKAGLYNPKTNPVIDWDLRATPEQWLAWKKSPLTLSKLGVTVSSGQLQFLKGDYRKMIRNPNMATAFLRCFNLL